MKTLKLLLAIAGFGAVVTAGAAHDTAPEYARVISVDPVYQRVARSVPTDECWIESVRVEQPVYEYRSKTNTLVGTMLGAAIGHQLGRDKKGKQIGRIAGAVLGASIATDADNRRNDSRYRVEYRDEERCETRYTTHYQQEVVGYDVAYQYHGKTYYTRMDRHPGDRIEVSVDVRPTYY